jgi:predicted nucleic acid-binding OB-fold protein
MTTTNQKFKKLTALAKASLQTLSENIITKKNGNYIVFSNYTITPIFSAFRVFKENEEIEDFSCSRNALAWCILDRKERSEAKELLEIDKQLSYKMFEFENLNACVKSETDPNRKEILIIKIIDNIAKMKHLRKQLVNSVSLAKYYQQQGIKNETRRIRKHTKI